MDPIALTAELVRIDSRNPALASDGPGEVACVRALRDVLDAAGFRTEVLEGTPGRPSLVARIGSGPGRSLMLNGHLDTVQTEGMTHPPFEPHRADGKLWGRGACDMKGGVAAMCAAAARAHAAGTLQGEVLITAVADEEWTSIGSREVIARGLRADAVVVTEPTECGIATAHKGFVWCTITVHGRAAHGSAYTVGVDAIRHAGHVLAALDHLDHVVLAANTHPLLGRGSVHASFIEGGIGMSTYPDRCVIRLERRTLPGVSDDLVRAQLQAVLDDVAARVPDFRAELAIDTSRPPSDLELAHPLVTTLQEATAATGAAAPVTGVTYWSDAALFNEAGMPTLCFGPGSIALAHGAEEWVPEADILRVTDALTELCARWTRPA
jgi:acetylornithine deacetylase